MAKGKSGKELGIDYKNLRKEYNNVLEAMKNGDPEGVFDANVKRHLYVLTGKKSVDYFDLGAEVEGLVSQAKPFMGTAQAFSIDSITGFKAYDQNKKEIDKIMSGLDKITMSLATEEAGVDKDLEKMTEEQNVTNEKIEEILKKWQEEYINSVTQNKKN